MSRTPWEDISNPDEGVMRRMCLDTSDRHKVVFHAHQMCDDVLEQNAAFRNLDNFSGSLWDGRDYVRVAQIPLVMLEKWAREDDINFYRWNEQDKARLMKRLNDPDYSKLRTAPGVI
jgi:hypothetical protein